MPNSENGRLVTCDLICAGAPSPGLWSSFLAWVEARTGKKVVGYDFRPKQAGTPLSVESLELSGKPAKAAPGRPLFEASLYATGREGYAICEDPLRCTGCSACKAACPKEAIAMAPTPRASSFLESTPASAYPAGAAGRRVPPTAMPPRP